MRNIWFTVTYEGTDYGGFQRQDNRMTVQEMLENVLQQLTGTHTTVYFVARTDAGVHAWAQECTFYTESRIPAERFQFAMNAFLPDNIRVRQSCEKEEDFSVRRTNKGKTYVYLLSEKKEVSPFLVRYVWRVGHAMDEKKMNEAAKVLIGRYDFTSFRGSNSVPSDPVRLIHDIRVIRTGSLLRIYVTGEGFLYHMVRNIAGCLADAGQGKLQPADIERILDARDRRQLGLTAPAEGLCLLHVYFEPITEESISRVIHEEINPWGLG
jgi:tRNA pseudouridine38-40 synthase